MAIQNERTDDLIGMRVETVKAILPFTVKVHVHEEDDPNKTWPHLGINEIQLLHKDGVVTEAWIGE